MTKYIIIVIAIVLGIGAVSFLFKNKESLNTSLVTNTSNSLITPTNTDTTTPTNTIINNTDNKKVMNATLNTSMGDITIEFFADQAPKTVANFTKLAKEGFYSGTKFHRVIKGFMIQGGDPLTKDDSRETDWGKGGPGYQFADEIEAKSDLYTKTGYKRGIVAMANSGANTNGSQFFIMHKDYPLPPSYTIFGKVVSGQDVVDKIANTPTNTGDRPVTPVVIKSVTLK
ncbi:MAG: peptidylprolyl isomerase [Candidatus Parcubacteria bacterium]|nr:peptidylprolyl isomerase [Candidatus Parcubacteria bacterium]